jgi:group I intron endonuclease
VISGIYAIENTVNGKIYIGSSIDILNRWKHHLRCLGNGTHANKGLQNDFSLLGFYNFTFKIVEQTDDLFEREGHFMKEMKTLDDLYGYNNLFRSGSYSTVKRFVTTKCKIVPPTYKIVPLSKPEEIMSLLNVNKYKLAKLIKKGLPCIKLYNTVRFEKVKVLEWVIKEGEK